MMLYLNGRFLTQQATGVQNYAREICSLLIANQVSFKILVPKTALIDSDLFVDNLQSIGFFTGHKWEQFDLALFMLKHPKSTLLNLCNTAPLLLKKQVVTIHDLAFLHSEQWFNKAFKNYYGFLIPKIARRSQHIISVSETIKKELVDLLGLASDKVKVIPNYVGKRDDISSKDINLNFKVSEPFYLMVGSSNPRKNFEFVKNVFSKKLSHNLVIAGGSHSNFNSSKVESTAENINELGYVNEQELQWLYSNCHALIMPSLYEGFGIPILDAFKYHKPVLCSDIPVFREVCEDAALYFDPTKSEELDSSLMALDAKRDQMIEKGKKRLAHYQNFDRMLLLKELLAL